MVTLFSNLCLVKVFQIGFLLIKLYKNKILRAWKLKKIILKVYVALIIVFSVLRIKIKCSK